MMHFLSKNLENQIIHRWIIIFTKFFLSFIFFFDDSIVRYDKFEPLLLMVKLIENDEKAEILMLE